MTSFVNTHKTSLTSINSEIRLVTALLFQFHLYLTSIGAACCAAFWGEYWQQTLMSKNKRLIRKRITSGIRWCGVTWAMTSGELHVHVVASRWWSTVQVACMATMTSFQKPAQDNSQTSHYEVAQHKGAAQFTSGVHHQYRKQTIACSIIPVKIIFIVT